MQRYGNKIYSKNSRNEVVSHVRGSGLTGLRNCKNKSKLKDQVCELLSKTWRDKYQNIVFAECIAFELNYKVKFIKQIFSELNIDGILFQKEREYSHDTNRNPMFYGNKSGWMANSYMIRRDPMEHSI